SVVKGAASTITHILVERGLFGYDTRVVEVWPEFGAHGKDKVTLRHVLSHTAGVPGIPLTTTIEDLCDWDKMCAVIADAELWWEPGTKIGYHAYTFGYIVGEIIRRITGQPISRVLKDELAGPLGMEKELYFGMPLAEQHRLVVSMRSSACRRPGGLVTRSAFRARRRRTPRRRSASAVWGEASPLATPARASRSP